MIQQIQYTPPTPKYNFPQPTTDTALPQRLTQLSIHSLRQPQYPPTEYSLNKTALQLNPHPIFLKPRREETIVTAIDTSTIKIGETNTGTLIAIRAATVHKQNRNYRYTRIGPFILHITEENKRDVYTTLQHAYINGTQERYQQNSPNLQQMPMRMANLLERWLQTTLAKNTQNSLILLDGSLTAGTPDTPAQTLRETLSNARQRRNIVLAFSKMTTLRTNGHSITNTPNHHKPPYLLETNGLKPKPPTVLLGEVYVAKLTTGSIAFRLDIDRETSFTQRIEAVERLLANDSVTQSYPESLRLAHILCTFTANEVIAMQHLITQKYGLKIVQRPDMHRLLFGLYGKGENAS